MIAPDALQEIIRAWKAFLREHDWQRLTEGVTPKQTGCGPVYELENFLNRENESFVIADMRSVKVAEPHYHPDPDVEIYLVLRGHALVVVGGEELRPGPGDAVVIPPDNVHFTIPKDDFVIAAINIPEFRPGHYITVDPMVSNPALRFDAGQFKRLTI